MMRAYNTLSGRAEPLPSPGRKPLRLFVCGPTVYDQSHIGHGRTYVIFDVIARYLRSRGYNVFYLQNITNVDDKIIRRAAAEGKNPFVLAARFAQLYLKDMRALGISAVNRYATATEFIPHIVKQVQKLIKTGHAYAIDGDGYYFDISAFPSYGKLSGRTAAQAEDAVSRIDESVAKRNRGDFCIWKFPRKVPATPKNKRIIRVVQDGEPLWWTPLGWGRPGWHIEDTAISEKFFGPQYDLHGGGLDLKFPHHEAEIAQQEAASGKTPFVKIWMHTGMLTVQGQKMSKSLKNFITISDFLKEYPASVFRLLVLQHHYRTPIDYSLALVGSTMKTFAHLNEFLAKLAFVERSGSPAGTEAGTDMAIRVADYESRFAAAMNEDFNTPQALAVVFDLVNTAYNILWNLSPVDAKRIKRFLEETLGDVFGVTLSIPRLTSTARILARRREEFRRHKQFIQADVLRKKLEALGYKVEDTPLGPLVLPY